MHVNSITSDLRKRKNHEEIARKIFLTYPTHAFIGKEDLQFEIFQEISNFFQIPIASIHVAGSAKVGISPHKKTPFCNKKSDLDISIINEACYLKYFSLVFKITNKYKDKTLFKNHDEYLKYIDYTSRGIFFFDNMPSCKERSFISDFFGNLSRKHREHFKDINGSIYLAEAFFEAKQKSAIYKLAEGVI